ncbi:hypothetical protein C7E12_20485, partial [Stenotrophomonas maltophilia]
MEGDRVGVSAVEETNTLLVRSTPQAWRSIREGGSSGSGSSNGSLNLPQRQPGNVSVSLEVEGDRVGVSAVEETNTLLVRSTPQAWRSIRE